MPSDMTPTSLEEFAERLDLEETLWVRAAVCRQRGGPFQLRLLEVTGGEPAAQWVQQRWVYPDAIFTATAMAGKAVAGWLRSKQVTIGDDEFTHEGFVEPLYWDRRDSWAQGQYEVLPWPCYETTLLNLANVEPTRPLASDDDAPSFASFYNAAATFFGLGARPVGGSVPTAAVLRWQDTAVRINRVRIAPNELMVDIEGRDFDRLTVELAGDEPGEQQQTWARPGRSAGDTLRFSLPAGLPAGAWVLVRRGSEWLDRRFLTWPWARGLEQGVEVEVPAQTKIEAFIANRENANVEFKRQVPTDDDSKSRVMKTVCAFANGDGGSILFGIDDDYRIVGLPAAKAPSLIDQVTQLIDSWVEPTPPCSYDLLEIENADTVIIELIVSAGSRLYGSSKPNEPRRVYVRHYARSVPARVSEIESIAQARGGSSLSWPRA